LPPTTVGLTTGFGAVWVVEPDLGSLGASSGTIERIDGLSGQVSARVPIRGDIRNGAIMTGSDAIWVLDQDGVLTRIDPASNRVSGRFATGALESYWFAPAAGYVWVCECGSDHDILRYDIRTRTAKRIELIQAPKNWASSDPLRNVPRTLVVGVDNRTGVVWFLRAGGASLVPWNPRTGRQTAPSIGLDGEPIQATMARGNVWVAARTVVNRVSIGTAKREMIPLPKGMNATGIAVDPATETVWVANSTATGTT